MSSAPALVTGASGFIGRHLVAALRAEGRAVRVLVRPASRRRAAGLFGDGRGVEIISGDLREQAGLERACRGTAEVYHVAGRYCFGPRQRRELHRVNVQGTENLLGAAWRARVDKFLHVSSAGVLRSHPAVPGPANGPEPATPAGGDRGTVTEQAFPDRPADNSPYQASKWLAECRALAWARRGLPVVIASPPCPVGTGDDRPTPTGQMIVDFLRGRFLFSTRTGLNFVAVEDVAEGLIAAARHGRTGERYLLGDRNLWLEEFLRLLAELTGRPAPRWRLPWAAVAVLGGLGELAGMLHPALGQTLCLETAAKARCVQFLDLTKARRELGWTPRHDLRESLARAVGWFEGGRRGDHHPGAAPPGPSPAARAFPGVHHRQLAARPGGANLVG